jgi:signal transduction histidine kinase
MVALVTVSIIRDRAWRSQEAAEEQQRTQQELGGLVELWQGLVIDRVDSWLTDLPELTDHAAREQQSRDKIAWFDAWYLWTADPELPRFDYPRAAPAEDVSALLRSTECMRAAHDMQVTGRRIDAALAFLECQDGTEAERLLASDLAATQLLAANRPQQAVDALTQASPPVYVDLAAATSRGLNPQRLLHRRLTLAAALSQTGKGTRRLAILTDTVIELTKLSGPDLVALLPRGQRLFEHELQGRVTPKVEETVTGRLARAERRVAGYQEVTGRLMAMNPAGPDANELHFVHDMYAIPGFLLIWTRLPDGRVGAVHLDVETMLFNLVRDDRRLGLNRPLVIFDVQGRPVRPEGIDTSASRVLAEVPLGHMLPHLRLALLAPVDDLTRQEITARVAGIAPLVLAVLLGVGALLVQNTATTREREFYKRQQDFIARVTHELKTPLAGIKVMAETLEMGAAEDPQSAAVFLGRILQEAEKLEKRIDEVLVAARQPTVAATTPMHIDELAQEVVNAWAPRYAQAGGAIETDLKRCPAVAADPALLRDAMNNLLDNALKYRREGTRGKVTVRTGEMGRWVVFEVTDNGIGVPPAMRKRVFERFERVEGHGRGKAGGHGLGLAFVADTAAAHGGLVECTEAPGGGARFRLKLRRSR